MENSYVIIGLGNPGSKYAKTRHNIGFNVLDAYAREQKVSWKVHSEYALAQLKLGEHSVTLIKPLTGMNNSGVVYKLVKQQGIDLSHVLVIHDELEIVFGKLGMRQGGSARGHNGLRSLIGSFGADFYRLRFGIGRPERREDVPDYVLSPFTAQEADDLSQFIPQATALIEWWIEGCSSCCSDSCSE
jgi:PTH1 family peptidyl-tRNA hydrolase